MARQSVAVDPLPAGDYMAQAKETTVQLAFMNGHQHVFPMARCTSDGESVRFFRDGQEVWSRNARYAAAHFTMTRLNPRESS